jgi:hypothetical protein
VATEAEEIGAEVETGVEAATKEDEEVTVAEVATEVAVVAGMTVAVVGEEVVEEDFRRGNREGEPHIYCAVLCHVG